MIKRLSPVAFSEVVEDEGESCLVFVTREDCKVCKKMHPLVERLSDEYLDFPFYEVDVNEMPDILTSNHLRGVPQAIFYRDGRARRVVTGDAQEVDFIDMFEAMK